MLPSRRRAGVLLLCVLAAATAVVGHGTDHHHAEDSHQVQDKDAAAASHGHAMHMDSHDHHGVPLLELNETQILLEHGVPKLSYYDLDNGRGDDVHLAYGSHSATMTAHIVFMMFAFVGALPTMICLRIAKHTFLAGLAQVVFLGTFTLGILCGIAFKHATPQLYPGQVHNTLGWIAYFLTLGLSSAQILRTCIILFSQNDKSISFAARIKHLFKPRSSPREDVDYAPLAQPDAYVDSPPESARPSFGDVNGKLHSPRPMGPARSPSWRRPHRAERSVEYNVPLGRWDSPSGEGASSDVMSPGSDDTLHENHLHTVSISPPLMRSHHPSDSEKPFSRPEPRSKQDVLRGIFKYTEIFLWRACVPFSWVLILSGVAVYSGGCRDSYAHICYAHLIKGSIFFWYGLLTFGRYCGAWAELGWAWNKKPKVQGTWREHWPSAEMVECFVIFLYGATNTWLERLGVEPGAPFTVRQVQHISIAVMYFFAGGAGMMLESKTVRGWISNAITDRVDAQGATRPASHSFSFNVFPALCIGVTGVAMAAHHQAYQFSVTVHSLWGSLLAGFSVFRLLTYFFLHLRPPASILPSRPPTEALASFCLAAGGIVFILSHEEIIIWAMRHGADDVMAIMNVTISFICFNFAWIIVLFAVKGWATKRSSPNVRLTLATGDEHIARKVAGAV